jgi:hypothetical protein
MTDRSDAYVNDKRTDKIVQAVLIDEVAAAQAAWAPTLKKPEVKTTAEHSHWNWNEKYQLVVSTPLAYRIFGLEAEEEMQGLMLVLTVGKFCRLEVQKGKPLIYVDYIATAPWNSPDVVLKPRFSGVGKVLIRTAIQLSEEDGLRGRIGLHSLPQSEWWYRDVCKMTEIGHDKSYQNLNYFEMTTEQSAMFMKG